MKLYILLIAVFGCFILGCGGSSSYNQPSETSLTQFVLDPSGSDIIGFNVYNSSAEPITFSRLDTTQYRHYNPPVKPLHQFGVLVRYNAPKAGEVRTISFGCGGQHTSKAYTIAIFNDGNKLHITYDGSDNSNFTF